MGGPKNTVLAEAKDKSLGFSQDFPSSDATFPAFFHSFAALAPLHQESLPFRRIFPLQMQNFHFFHLFTLPRHFHRIFLFLMQNFVRLPTFWPYCTKKAGFFSQDFSTCLVLLHQKLVGFHRTFPFTGFSLLMQKFPHAQTNIPPWCQQDLQNFTDILAQSNFCLSSYFLHIC